MQATDGNFYGVTSAGGANGNGTIFRITPGGRFTTLHSFDSTDGGGFGCGVFFKITLGGSFTVLRSFDSTGSGPNGLVQGTDGNFYGTTVAGGTHQSGTVFRISKDGTLRTLYNFCVHTTCPDGSFPASSLIQGSDGNFYGTTPQGGINNSGTVFMVTPVGKLTTLYTFCSLAACADGGIPDGGLIQATDGNFYGTTSSGGAHTFYGTVFKITPEGTLSTLHSFDLTDGNRPSSGLLEATDGKFYGTTETGGTGGNCPSGCGTVFSLDTGLEPFVSLVRSSGRFGSPIGILGQGFTGTTEVSVNGTAAAFTVVSDTYLTAKVPSGATTGFVTVTTPSGSLTSNKQFVVKP